VEGVAAAAHVVVIRERERLWKRRSSLMPQPSETALSKPFLQAFDRDIRQAYRLGDTSAVQDAVNRLNEARLCGLGISISFTKTPLAGDNGL
jgi:DNA-binding MurR/RpiR family transcriptional regulator